MHYILTQRNYLTPHLTQIKAHPHSSCYPSLQHHHPERTDPMFRLASMLYAIFATSLAGIGVIAVLTMGYDTLIPIVGAAAVGAVIAVPVTLLVAKRILG